MWRLFISLVPCKIWVNASLVDISDDNPNLPSCWHGGRGIATCWWITSSCTCCISNLNFNIWTFLDQLLLATSRNLKSLIHHLEHGPSYEQKWHSLYSLMSKWSFLRTKFSHLMIDALQLQISVCPVLQSLTARKSWLLKHEMVIVLTGSFNRCVRKITANFDAEIMSRMLEKLHIIPHRGTFSER